MDDYETESGFNKLAGAAADGNNNRQRAAGTGSPSPLRV